MTTRTLSAAVLALALAAAVPTAADAAARKPQKDPRGHYVGTEVPEEANGLDDIVLDFDVSRAGRKIKNFTISMNVVCSSYPISVEYVVQPMNTMKINPRTGRFRDTVTGSTDGGTTYSVAVTGRLKGTKVKDGTLSYDVGVCQRGTGDDGPVAWQAARASKG